MTIARTYFLVKWLRRAIDCFQRRFAELVDQRKFLLHRSTLIAYPVRTRGRLDSTGSP